MHFSTALFTSVAALAVGANAAVGHAVVKNNCAAPVYLWSVGSAVGPMQTINPGKSYSQVLHHDAKSGGISLKITKTANGLYDGSPQTNFAYTLDGSQTWYDLSDVFGDAFSGKSVSVVPSSIISMIVPVSITSVIPIVFTVYQAVSVSDMGK